jgi:putative ABC transport system permease protein
MSRVRWFGRRDPDGQSRVTDGTFDDEVQFHLDARAAELQALGQPPDVARAQAEQEFGDADGARRYVTSLDEGTRRRRMRRLTMIGLGQDIRYAARLLVRNPSFSAVAVVTMALGVGVNAAVFTLVNAVLLRPLSLPEPDRLVVVGEVSVKNPQSLHITSAPNFLDWQRQSDVFEHMALLDSAGRGYSVSGDGQQPLLVSGVRVTAGCFDTLAVRPFLGRAFLPEEEPAGRDHEVILSYGLWVRRYGADRSIVGHAIRVDGQDDTVVGVMPKGFQFQFWSGPRDLWVPVGYATAEHDRGSHMFVALGRLRTGVTLAQANAEMDAIGRRLALAYPDSDAGKSVRVLAAAGAVAGNLKSSLWALLGAVGLVLLIACANVANLLLARGATRTREMTIRLALGSGRARLLRQLLTESLLLAMVGGTVGAFLAVSGTAWVSRLAPAELRFLPLRPLNSLTLDARVLLFMLLITCVSGVLFGLAPAVRAMRGDPSRALAPSARGSTDESGTRTRHVLVAAEVAVALVVLAGAGLMVKSLARLLDIAPGFDPKNVLVMTVPLPQQYLFNGPPDEPRFCQGLQDHVATIPGVLSVGAAAHLPLAGPGAGRGLTIEGRSDPGSGNEAGADYSVACPNYLRTMGIPLVVGREFTAEDTLTSSPVAVINQAMERKYWPNLDALGKRFKIGLFHSDAPWLTVIGVYRDAHHSGLDQAPPPEFLRPYTQAAWPSMTIAVRTAASPGFLEEPVRAALATFEPDRAASEATTLEEIVSGSVDRQRFPMLLLSGFAVFALALVGLGIASVVGYSVVLRTREIGIRVALGARAVEVFGLVMGRSLLWTLAGVAVGLGAAIGLTRWLSSLLFEVTPTDPVVLGAVAGVLVLVALLASYVPARRAAALDPMTALRGD